MGKFPCPLNDCFYLAFYKLRSTYDKNLAFNKLRSTYDKKSRILQAAKHLR